MIQRLYVHNFKCLENFELVLKDLPSALLIGKNGSGKSAIRKILELLQAISRGINRMSELARLNIISPKDFACGRFDVPIRVELEALLNNRPYRYVLVLDLPENFKELRVLEEQLTVDGAPIYARKKAEVTIYTRNTGAQFSVDWHLVALPVIHEQSESDPLYIFRTWVARMIILAPIPSLITGESSAETLEPKRDGLNFGEWFSGLIGRYPAAYTFVDKYLREIMPDIQDVVNEQIGKDFKTLIVRFESEAATLSINFNDLSDGEKCFFLCAVVLAANKSYGPLFCFWDEPDNYLSLSEVGHFITELRRSFKNNGQFLATSHNDETIRKFSAENTFVLGKKSHLEPTTIRPLTDVAITGDITNAIIRGEIEQ